MNLYWWRDYPWYICFVECDTLNSTYMIFKKISCTKWGLSFLWELGLSYCIAQVNSLQFFKEGEGDKTCIDYRFVFQRKSCKMSLFKFCIRTSMAAIGVFEMGSGPIWMNDVQCEGHETSLANCSFTGYGVHNCDHEKDAGVVCDMWCINEEKLNVCLKKSLSDLYG